MTTNHTEASRTSGEGVRNGSIDQDQHNSVARDHWKKLKFVRADVGFDGSRWHSVSGVEPADDDGHDRIRTACGATVKRWKADRVVAESDPQPEMSGNTICYGCVRSSRGDSR